MEKEVPVFNQLNEESTVHTQELLTRKENNINNIDSLKTDSILNEKNEIYNDNEKCSQIMIMNKIIDYSQQDSNNINKLDIVQDNNNQINNHINSLPIISDRPNFYLDNANKVYNKHFILYYFVQF